MILLRVSEACVSRSASRLLKTQSSSSAPVTSVILSPNTPKDTLLIASLDSTIRLLDRSNGQMLAEFRDDEFKNDSYRSQVAFGHGEGTVLAGDDKGRIWVWDLATVSTCSPNH